MSVSLTIPLTNPVEFDGTLISSFTIRRPTYEDLERSRRDNNVGRRVRGLRFIGRLIDIPQRAFGEIEERDEVAAKAVWRFVSSHMGW